MLSYSLIERRLRIYSGVLLAIYVCQHLLNHGLGLISLSAMESMRSVVTPFWRSPVGAIWIYGSLLLHFLLALWSLLRRTTLRMPAWEASQIILGISIIPLMAGHIAGTWGGRVILQIDIDYEHVIKAISSNSWWTTRQFFLVLITWFHVGVGLHFWLRLKKWYRPALPVTYVLIVLIPLFALLGASRIALELEAQATSSSYSSQSSYSQGNTNSYSNSASSYGNQSDSTTAGSRYSYGATNSDKTIVWTIDDLRYAILGGFYILLVLTLLLRWLRILWQRRSGQVNIHHPSGKIIKAKSGQTLLEAIRAHGIPHASVCGGRGRCTTCRVRIGQGLEGCAAAESVEQAALKRINAEPNMRLACQTRVICDLSITPLVEPDAGIDAAHKPGSVQGSEQQVVTMFVDLRGSTRMGEKHLPYDVLFILNRFFSEMTAALHDTHGHYSNFTGDGLMAMYGLERGLEQGCKDAMQGAYAMQARLDKMNQHFANELEEPLRIGIGINCGDAIVGNMGPPSSPNYSAIGDSVNTAARLEALSKEYQCVLVVAKEVVRLAKADASGWPIHSVVVRGKTEPLNVYAVGLPI